MNDEIPYEPPGMAEYIREGARKNAALLRKMQGQPAALATAEAKPDCAPRTGSVSAEQWWSHHAELLAAKMKVGGVKSFRIELNAIGNYEFEVVPTADTPNDKLTHGATR